MTEALAFPLPSLPPSTDQPPAMRLSRSESAPNQVVTVQGEVRAKDQHVLSAAIVEALSATSSSASSRDGADVILDARQASVFEMGALPALTAARSRAKWLKHRIVVVDEGALAAALLSSGLHARFPVFATMQEAQDGLAALRRDRRLVSIGLTAQTDTPATA